MYTPSYHIYTFVHPIIHIYITIYTTKYTLNTPLTHPIYALYTPLIHQVPALSLWVLFEWAHFRCQLTLRGARGVRDGSGSFTERVSPMLDGAVLYSKIASPHYLLETCGWVAFTCATGGVRAAWAFTIIGFFTMLCWATQRYDHVKGSISGGGPTIRLEETTWRDRQRRELSRRTPMLPLFDFRFFIPRGVGRAVARATRDRTLDKAGKAGKEQRRFL